MSAFDCGACEPVCPVEAIFYEDDVPEQWSMYTQDNARFFTEVLPGRDEPVGSPGGASQVGPLPTDTPLVAGLPPRRGRSRDDERPRRWRGPPSAGA